MPTFNLSFAAGTTVQQMLGFEIAARVWSSYLTDNATINLHVGVSSSLPSNVIGGALPGMRANQSYSTVRSLLSADRRSTDDNTAVKNLATGSYLPVQMCADIEDPSNPGYYVINSQTSTLNLTRANAKAIGMSLTDGATALDGYILFGSLAGAPVTWSYDYSRTAPAASNSLDFLSTAIHEIGHILGFVSGVDKPGWLTQTYNSFSAAQSFLNQRAPQATTLDLFRYSQYSKSYGSDLSYGYLHPGSEKYFSIDKGRTSIAQFATGADANLLGDGQQASHWKSGTNAIMAPTLATGQRPIIGSIDLRALDVIGWDLASLSLGTLINLLTVQTAAQQALATRAGQSLTWLNNNLNLSPTQLVQDRTADIKTMIQTSQIYNLGDETGDEFWQKVNNLFWEQGLFETLDELEVLAADDMAGSENPGWALPGAISVDLTGVINLANGGTSDIPFQAHIQFKFDLSNLLGGGEWQPTQAVPQSVIQAMGSLSSTDFSLKSGFNPTSIGTGIQPSRHWSSKTWASFSTSRTDQPELDGKDWEQLGKHEHKAARG